VYVVVTCTVFVRATCTIFVRAFLFSFLSPLVLLPIAEEPGVGLCLIAKRSILPNLNNKISYQPVFVSIRFQGATFATQSGVVFTIGKERLLRRSREWFLRSARSDFCDAVGSGLCDRSIQFLISSAIIHLDDHCTISCTAVVKR
jgi:hypothetical protein